MEQPLLALRRISHSLNVRPAIFVIRDCPRENRSTLQLSDKKTAKNPIPARAQGSYSPDLAAKAGIVFSFPGPGVHPGETRACRRSSGLPSAGGSAGSHLSSSPSNSASSKSKSTSSSRMSSVSPTSPRSASSSSSSRSSSTGGSRSSSSPSNSSSASSSRRS